MLHRRFGRRRTTRETGKKLANDFSKSIVKLSRIGKWSGNIFSLIVFRVAVEKRFETTGRHWTVRGTLRVQELMHF